MVDFQNLAINEVLSSELGKRAHITLYNSENRTPMTFVLKEAEKQIGSTFSVYWVENGPPELFTLLGFSPSPVVFNTRYLSFSAFIRQLFLGGALENVLDDVTERIALKLMAELALRKGDSDYSVLAFTKSLLGKSIWTNDFEQTIQLELEPKNEAYMATWFYGLLHELGHLYPNKHEEFSNNQLFSDEWMRNATREALNNFSIIPDTIKQEALVNSMEGSGSSILRFDHLRDEGLADTFAASVLFKTTVELMHEIGQDSFEITQFISELVISTNIIAFMDRCRRAAIIASTAENSRSAAFEALIHPVSIYVRVLMQRRIISPVIASYIYDEHPDDKQIEAVEGLIDEINQSFSERFKKIEKGFSRAIEFSIFPERRENDQLLLGALQKEFKNSSPAFIEAKRFCERAESLGKDSKLITALKQLVENFAPQ